MCIRDRYCIPSIIFIFIIHGPQYRLLAGEMVASGFLNEILSIISLVALTYLYKQRSVSKEEIAERLRIFEEQIM